MGNHRSVGITIILIVVVTAVIAYMRWGRPAPLAEGLIQVNGRIEGDSVTVASKFSGRIVRLLAREGDAVEEGKAVVRLDDIQACARRDQAEAELRAAIAQEQGAGEGISLTAGTTNAQVLQAQGLVAQSESSIASAKAEVSRAAAAVATASATARSGHANTATARAGVEAAQAQHEKAQAGVSSAQATLETARATLRAAHTAVEGAQAVYETAARDAKRAATLAAEGAMSAQTADQTESHARQAKAQWEGSQEQVSVALASVTAKQSELHAARQQVKAAEAGISQAKAQWAAAREQEAAARAGVRQVEAQLRAAQELVRQGEARLQQAIGQLDQARTAPHQVAVSRSQRAQAQARIRQARAALRELESVLKDLSILAPVSGTVTTRFQDVGEVVTAGTPLLELVNLDRLYLKVYVPENQIGKLRLGLPAQIYTDAFPHRPFAARVGYISSRAEFTPKEVQTPDERVKQVYAVKLYLEQNPEHLLTPGLPADAMIRWKEDTPWAEPRW